MAFIPTPLRISRGLAVGMNGGFKSFTRGSVPRKKVWGFILIPSLILSSFFEWTVGTLFPFAGISVPIFVSFMIFGFWRMNFTSRIYLGFLAGLLMDGVSPHSAGTYLVLFLALAVLTEGLQKFFSDTESVLTKGICLSISLLIFINILYPVSAALEGNSSALLYNWLVSVFLASIFWSLLLPLFFLSAEGVFLRLIAHK